MSTTLAELEQRVCQLAEEICPDYPDIKSCEMWEKLYALQLSFSGFLATNSNLRLFVDGLRKRLQLSQIDSVETGRPVKRRNVQFNRPSATPVFSCSAFRELLDIAQSRKVSV